jgi:hypothetical protein
MSNETTALRKKTVNLDQAILVTTPNGAQVKRIITTMTLSADADTLVKIMGGYGNVPAVYILTANAFMQVGARCGVVLNHPDSVIVDGREQPNGFRDTQGTYYFRSQCGGFTATGQPFVTDRTVDFNVETYNLLDLLSKAKSDKTARYFKVLPAQMKSPGDEWACYKVDDGINLWMDTSAPDIAKWLGEFVNRRKNAIRICQTFADRNAIAAQIASMNSSATSSTPQTLRCGSNFQL